MGEGNGVSNVQLLKEINESRFAQETSLTKLETIIEKGLSSVVEELKGLRNGLISGLLKIITVLCSCLVVIIMWVTAIKTLPQIFGITPE
jgi:hypothetical protein